MDIASRKRIRTGPLPSLPAEAFVGPRTLESRLLPGVVVVVFVALLAIQAGLAF